MEDDTGETQDDVGGGENRRKRKEDGEEIRRTRKFLKRMEKEDKRKREEEEAEVRRTEKFLRKLDREDKRKREAGDEGDQHENIAEVAGYVVPDEEEEEILEMDEEVELGEGSQNEELDPEMVKEGRREEVEFMREKLDVFEIGTYGEAMARSGGKPPTTTKWVEGWKNNDDGSRFVRSRLVARDFKPKREENPEEMFAAMPPLGAKKLLFRMAAGVRGWRRKRRAAEIKLMFIDVRKARLNAVCDEEA